MFSQQIAKINIFDLNLKLALGASGMVKRMITHTYFV